MYFCSLTEQNCYHVSKRPTPLDNAPRLASASRVREQFPLASSMCRVGFCNGAVNGTSVLLELVAKGLSYQWFLVGVPGWGTDWNVIRSHCCECTPALEPRSLSSRLTVLRGH